MRVTRGGSQASTPGPAEWFTGTVLIVTFGSGLVQESLDGKAVEWLEKVTDEEYRR